MWCIAYNLNERSCFSSHHHINGASCARSNRDISYIFLYFTKHLFYTERFCKSLVKVDFGLHFLFHFKVTSLAPKAPFSLSSIACSNSLLLGQSEHSDQILSYSGLQLICQRTAKLLIHRFSLLWRSVQFVSIFPSLTFFCIKVVH